MEGRLSVQRPYRRPKAVGSDRGGGGSASSSCDSSGSSSSSSNSKNSYNIADLMWLAATAAAVVETETAATAMTGQYQTTIKLTSEEAYLLKPCLLASCFLQYIDVAFASPSPPSCSSCLCALLSSPHVGGCDLKLGHLLRVWLGL